MSNFKGIEQKYQDFIKRIATLDTAQLDKTYKGLEQIANQNPCILLTVAQWTSRQKALDVLKSVIQGEPYRRELQENARSQEYLANHVLIEIKRNGLHCEHCITPSMQKGLKINNCPIGFPRWIDGLLKENM